jgi:hypothetical protein
MWWRAGSRVVRAHRAHCFVCRQRAMSRLSAGRLHAVMLDSLSSRCLRMLRMVRVLGPGGRAISCVTCSSRSTNSSHLESLMLFKLLI